MQFKYHIEAREDYLCAPLYVANTVMEATKGAPYHTNEVLYYLILRKHFHGDPFIPVSEVIAAGIGWECYDRSVRRCLQWLEANGWLYTLSNKKRCVNLEKLVFE
jgi:hypothetical protein